MIDRTFLVISMIVCFAISGFILILPFMVITIIGQILSSRNSIYGSRTKTPGEYDKEYEERVKKVEKRQVEELKRTNPSFRLLLEQGYVDQNVLDQKKKEQKDKETERIAWSSYVRNSTKTAQQEKMKQ